MRHLFSFLLVSLLVACNASVPETGDVIVERARDFHSYANLDEVRVTHVELDLTVLFLSLIHI